MAQKRRAAFVLFTVMLALAGRVATAARPVDHAGAPRGWTGTAFAWPLIRVKSPGLPEQDRAATTVR
jgi:hypothetical protein